MGIQMHFNDAEALLIAISIEERGAALYQRAVEIVSGDDVRAVLRRLLEDETRHAARFRAMYDALLEKRSAQQPYPAEAAIFLRAIAADVVYKGGVMGQAMEGGLDSIAAVLHAAIGAEKDSLLYYLALQEHARADLRAALKAIVAEESGHLSELQGYLHAWA